MNQISRFPSAFSALHMAGIFSSGKPEKKVGRGMGAKEWGKRGGVEG